MQQHALITFLSIKAEMGSRGGPQAGTNGETRPEMAKNGQKWPKIEISGKWWENGVVIAWSSFFSIDIIATAPCDYSFVNKSEVGIKRLAMNRHKWPKMIKNPIFN